MLDRVVFAGAGRTIQTVLDRVQKLAPVLILDTSQATLDELALTSAGVPNAAPGEGSHPIEKRLGDATSQFVLEEIRGEKHASIALVAATGDDRRNIEVCRIASLLKFRPIVGIVIDPAAASQYEAHGARAIVRPQILASVVEQSLRYDGLVMASAVGQGKGEIIEFVVLPSSPAVGASLAQLQADRWRIAAIYRGGELVIPTGETTIRAEDRLLVIGHPEILPSIAEELRVGVPQFPLRFGNSLVVYLPSSAPEAIEQEAEQLVRKTRATALVRVQPNLTPKQTTLESSSPGSSTDTPRGRAKIAEDIALKGDQLEQHLAQLQALRPGIIVTHKPRQSFFARLFGRLGDGSILCNRVACPVLFTHGTPRYARIVHPLLPSIDDLRVADLSIDLARLLNLPLVVISVSMPLYLEDKDERIAKISAELDRRAQLHGLRTEHISLEGNPIVELHKWAQPDDLLVLPRRATSRDSYTTPDVPIRIAAGPGSALVYTLATS